MYQSYSQSLPQYLDQAIENNPALQSSFKQYQASLEKVNQVSLENPQLNIGVFTRPMELLMGNQRAEASVMQMFPWFGMLKTQRDEATIMAQARYQQFREERNQVLYQVKEVYFQLQQLQHTIEVTQENLEILRTLEELSIIRFQGGNTISAASAVGNAVRGSGQRASSGSSGDNMGMGSKPSPSGKGSGGSSNQMSSMGGGSDGAGKLTDVLRIQVQIKAMESQLEQLEDDKKPLMVKFNQLLGREKDELVMLETQEQSKSIFGMETDYLDSILYHNPMILMLEYEGQAFSKQAEMARLDGRPMFGIGLNYMVFSPRNESGEIGGANGMGYMPGGMGNNMVMPMVSISLPIHRKQYKSRQAEAENWRQATELQKEAIQNNLETEFEYTLTSIKASERNIKLLTEQIALMEQTLELAVTAYATSGSSFEEILSIQRELLDFKLSQLIAGLDQKMAYARLETLIGY